jgi:hypothetical protein
MRRFEVGDHVVYRKAKISASPGPRAKRVRPAAHGEDYVYAVDKFWTVSAIVDEETIELVTRRGKVHQVRVDDPMLRKAGPLCYWLWRSRFPEVDASKPAEAHAAE